MSQYIRYPAQNNGTVTGLTGDVTGSGSGTISTTVVSVGGYTAAAVGIAASQAVYNAKDYGAVGNGIADDAPALNSAVAAISALGGGTLFIPPGTYLLGTISGAADSAYSYIIPKSNVSIKGAGLGSTILKVANGQNLASRGTTGPNIIATASASPLSNCEFSGITFDWNGSHNLLSNGGGDNARNNASIYSLNGGINILVENCLFKETPGDQCILLTATSDLGQKNITVRNCEFVDSGSALTGNYCADHSSVYCNASNLVYEGNKFYVTTGLFVAGTCFEIHGSNSLAIGNVGDSYDLGTWIATDYQAITNIALCNNVFTKLKHGFNLAGATYAINDVRVLGNVFEERSGASYSSPTWFCNDGNTVAGCTMLHVADNQFVGQSSSGTLRFMQLYKIAEFIFVNNRVEKFSNFGIQGAGVTIGSSKFANTILINDNQFIDVVQPVYFNDNTLAVSSFNVNDNSFLRTSADANACITLTASSSAGFIFDNFFDANYSTQFAGTPNGVIFGTGQDITLAAVGSSPNANAATLAGQVLNLQPADATHPGVVTTGTQTFAGTKTFSSTISGSINGNAATSTTCPSGSSTGSNTGDVSLASVGSSPAAAGASLSGQTLTLQPADATHPGVVTTGSQTFAGAKTFSSTIAADISGNAATSTTCPSGSSTGSNTGDISLGAIGSSANANGASLAGQVLTLQPASASFGGILTTGSQTIAGTKTFSGNIDANNIASVAVASTIMQRDANINTRVNAIAQKVTSTSTSGSTLTLTVASAPQQQFTGSSAHTMVMPDATTLNAGWAYYVMNRSTGAITVNKNGGAAILVVAAGATVKFVATDISTSAGTWDFATGVLASTVNAVAATALTLTGDIATGGDSIILNANTALSTGNIANFKNNGTAKAQIDYNGNAVINGIIVAKTNPTWGSSITPDCSASTDFVINATDTTTVPTINSASNPTTRQYIRIFLQNGSGGTMQTPVWDAAYHFQANTAPTKPTNGRQFCVEFRWTGSVWWEIARATDVPS